MKSRRVLKWMVAIICLALVGSAGWWFLIISKITGTRWEYRSDHEFTVRYVDEKRVFCTLQEYSLNGTICTITCLDRRRGKRQWYHETSDSETGHFFSSNRCYYGVVKHRQSWFVCRDAANGNVLWEVKVPGEVAGSTAFGSKVSYFTRDGTAATLSSESGDVIWVTNLVAPGQFRTFGTLGGIQYQAGRLLVDAHASTNYGDDRDRRKLVLHPNTGAILLEVGLCWIAGSYLFTYSGDGTQLTRADITKDVINPERVGVTGQAVGVWEAPVPGKAVIALWGGNDRRLHIQTLLLGDGSPWVSDMPDDAEEILAVAGPNMIFRSRSREMITAFDLVRRERVWSTEVPWYSHWYFDASEDLWAYVADSGEAAVYAQKDGKLVWRARLRHAALWGYWPLGVPTCAGNDALIVSGNALMLIPGSK
jgi:outer membrane protein assembly factor BamB